MPYLLKSMRNNNNFLKIIVFIAKCLRGAGQGGSSSGRAMLWAAARGNQGPPRGRDPRDPGSPDLPSPLPLPPAACSSALPGRELLARPPGLRARR